MDVGMSIASTIQELYDRNPKLGGKDLFVSGIRVGRDMMGTMANTLILLMLGVHYLPLWSIMHII